MHFAFKQIKTGQAKKVLRLVLYNQPVGWQALAQNTEFISLHLNSVREAYSVLAGSYLPLPMGNFDYQLAKFESYLISDVKLPKESTHKVASLMLEEMTNKKELILLELNDLAPISQRDRLEELASFQEMMDTLNSMEQSQK